MNPLLPEQKNIDITDGVAGLSIVSEDESSSSALPQKDDYNDSSTLTTSTKSISSSMKSQGSSATDDLNSSVKSTRFQETVKVLSHDTVVGQHPDCLNGPALELGWKYSVRTSMLRNHCDKEKYPNNYQKNIQLQPITKKKKVLKLKEFGFSKKDMDDAVKESQRIQSSRIESNSSLRSRKSNTKNSYNNNRRGGSGGGMSITKDAYNQRKKQQQKNRQRSGMAIQAGSGRQNRAIAAQNTRINSSCSSKISSSNAKSNINNEKKKKMKKEQVQEDPSKTTTKKKFLLFWKKKEKEYGQYE